MTAVTEGHVVVDVAPDVETVPVWEDTLVPVRRSGEAQHGVAGWNLQPIQLRVVINIPGDLCRRRLVTKDLLDCIGDERAVVDEFASCRGGRQAVLPSTQ